MIDYIMGPEATVEMIRAMRAIGHFPTPPYVADLVKTIGDICSETEPEPDGRFYLEIASPPWSLR